MGLLVVIEGAYGVGKSTLIKGLASKIEDFWPSADMVQVQAFPTPEAKKRATALRAAKAHEREVTEVFLQDMAAWADRNSRGKAGLYLVDRYFWSTMAYAHATNSTQYDFDAFARRVRELRIPTPTMTLFLYTDRYRLLERLEKRDGSDTRDRDIMQAVQLGYTYTAIDYAKLQHFNHFWLPLKTQTPEQTLEDATAAVQHCIYTTYGASVRAV